MREEARKGNGDRLEKRQRKDNKIGEEEKQKEKQVEIKRTRGREKKKGKSDGDRRNRQQEAKTNVIIPSSVGQRAF